MLSDGAMQSLVVHIVLLPVSTTHGRTSRQLPADSGYRTAALLWKQYLLQTRMQTRCGGYGRGILA